MTEFRSFDNSTCKKVLDPLKPSDLTLGQVVIKRVARGWAREEVGPTWRPLLLN